MKNDRLGILDYIMLFIMMGLMFMAASCTKEDDLFIEPQLVMMPNLDKDTNGYYHLELNPNTNQTIHRVDGMVTSIFEPTKVSFSSNLFWEYQGEDVQTSNFSSWATPDDPYISNVIAPIYSMRTDTLTLTIRINEWDIIQTLNIVLD